MGPVLAWNCNPYLVLAPFGVNFGCEIGHIFQSPPLKATPWKSGIDGTSFISYIWLSRLSRMVIGI